MPIEFDKIREENIKRYGTDIDQYGPVLLENLYSDQTHFIYELLQNAEDAGARKVKFTLRHDCLEFEHDGRPFNENDVRGICGLVKGTKKDDLTKIGTFGIGFKSVYAHTRSPEIHCGGEHFVVRNYVQPCAVDSRSSELGTYFFFPFNRLDRTSEESFDAISNRLRDLGIRTLLFLNNIESIEYEIDGDSNGVYIRQLDETLQADFVTRVRILGQRNLGIEEENWLVFKRNVSNLTQDKSQPLFVEIAFLLSDRPSGKSPEIEPLSQSELVVFFPTEQETRLGFLMQGPYRTTPARDNIPHDNDFNKQLVVETGELVVDALRWLRDREWLTVKVLQTLPIAYRERRYSWSQEEHAVRKYAYFLEPVYQRVKDALLTDELIPSSSGGYVAARNIKAGSAALRELLDHAQMKELLDFQEGILWLSDEITEDRTQDLWRFLTTILEVENIDADKFVRRIDSDFMRNQSDEWIRSFYEFAPTSPTIKRILCEKPIIRLADGSHVKPFQGNEPQAYLPSDYESDFPTVKQEVCNSTKSLSFLKNLGLKKPDIVDEVIQLILPKYNEDNYIDEEEHLQDLKIIAKALDTDSSSRKEDLIRELKTTAIIRATSATGSSEFRNPGDVYFRSPELEIFFDGNPNAWFSTSYDEQYNDLLRQLGVSADIRVSLRRPLYSRDNYVIIISRHSWHVRGLNGFDPDFSIDGLEFALSNSNIERSQFIWNKLLIPNKHLIQGEVESSRRQDYFPSEKKTQVSVTGKLLREKAWLPDGKGGFVTPAQLPLDELPDGFHRDGDLAKALGMRTPIGALLENLDIPESDRRKMEFSLGLSEEEMKLIQEKREKEREKPETLKAGEFPSEMEDSFDQPGVNPNKQPKHVDTSQQGDPDDLQAAAEMEISSEPDVEKRYELRTKRKWEAKNPATRKFLMNEYGGECQICRETFNKRDGQPYFEAVHFIRRTKAKWLDHPRNALCLCANHSAQFMYGVISTPEENIIEEIQSSDENQSYHLDIVLCEEPKTITFSSNHIDELRAGLDAADQF